MLRVDDFDFDLPSDLIAQHPPLVRGASRLLQVTGKHFIDRQFADLPSLLECGDLLVFNDTKVIKARFWGCKASGGRVEVLLERIVDDRLALAQIRVSKSPKAGSRIELENAFNVVIEGREGEFYQVSLDPNLSGNWWDLADRYGHLPLPPYIAHPAEQDDELRYQTVYARAPGAVAAPTAGLHFDEAILARLAEKGIETASLTLHVGAGTFQPVRVESLSDHKMHREHYEIPVATVAAIERTKQSGKKVIAVGTTSLRALEAAAAVVERLGAQSGLLESGAAQTDIFITPGYSFKVVDRLLTNFHLPRSTLLMLVSAFSGFDEIKAAYMHAIAARYRFFSYGDAMLLDCNF